MYIVYRGERLRVQRDDKPYFANLFTFSQAVLCGPGSWYPNSRIFTSPTPDYLQIADRNEEALVYYVMHVSQIASLDTCPRVCAVHGTNK